MREATASDGSHVVLKFVDDDTEELDILTALSKIKLPANHTIELYDTVIAITKVIALRRRIPLQDYRDDTESAASFPKQLLEGVAFLHDQKVAHMDLKPGNVEVDGVDPERPVRLLIIDFGVSVRVDSEDTTIKGFRGTPPWVAPEVGKPNGPTMEYSPIRADRWACGQMMTFLKRRFRGGRGPDQKVRALMSDHPGSRLSLKEVLKEYLEED
jgi:serine/threonine protein kinase